MHCLATFVLAVATLAASGLIADEPTFDRKKDVIYGRKFGTALTLDVFTPKENANGAASSMWSAAAGSRRTTRSTRPMFTQLLRQGTRSSPSSTAASRSSRFPRSSATCTAPSASSGSRQGLRHRPGPIGSPAARPAGICR